MKQEKRFIKIKDYIGTFDNFLNSKTCNNLIKIFEKNKDSLAYSRKKAEGTTEVMKKDLAVSFNKYNTWHPELEDVCKILRETLDIYEHETSFCSFTNIKDLHFTNIKLQKTSPSEGYHVWHVEQNYVQNDDRRALVWTVYLNDVEKGGETEFLVQKQRVQSKQGRICIFPASFPYLHRGNPPLEKDKYILTSWWLT